jgi:pilus assembly protein CpaF
MPPLADPGQVAKAVADRVVGMGPLQPYFDDPDIEEIWINEPGKVFVATSGRPQLTTTVLTEQQVHDLVEVMLRASGHRVDLSSPFVDATLADAPGCTSSSPTSPAATGPSTSGGSCSAPTPSPSSSGSAP